MSSPCARPGEECQDRPWRPSRIAKVEMISARIIEIDGALDQPQPEQSDIKIEVALRITGDGGNVMKSGDFLVHGYHTVATSISKFHKRVIDPRVHRACLVRHRLESCSILTFANLANQPPFREPNEASRPSHQISLELTIPASRKTAT